MLLVKGPSGTATVTERYSMGGVCGREEDIDVASETSQGREGVGMVGVDVTRGWSVWKAAWSWRRERAWTREMEVGRGVSVARV